MVITPVRPNERQELLNLAISTGLFSPGEAESLLGGVLDSLSARELQEGHAAVACRCSSGNTIMGWSYYAPDPYAEGVLNVWWIGVDPQHFGQGIGHALLSSIEEEASKTGARVVVVETSDQPLLARARAFYRGCGYVERGRIPDFYGVNEAKVIFSRTLNCNPSSVAP